MKATVSERGQVTIPKRLRERLGIRPGEQLDFIEEGGRLIATKVLRGDPLDDLFGLLGNERATDEIMLELRGPVEAVDP